MSTLRRVFAVVRLRRLIAAGLFLFCTYLFANNLDPTPQYVVQTRTERERESLKDEFFGRTTVHGVSDDGSQIILAYHVHGMRASWIDRLELWNSATGRNETPAHWYSREWRKYLDHGDVLWCEESRLANLALSPSGQGFLRDGPAWISLGRRLAIDWEAKTDHFWRKRDDLRFSSDGRHIAYMAPTGWPDTTHWPEEFSKATVIEDARTGRRVATLPAVTAEVTVAPGGRTAVWCISPIRRYRGGFFISLNADGEIGERPSFALWDFETSSIRALLWHRDDCFGHAEYTPDGRYVFASSVSRLRWWDAATGEQVGDIVRAETRKFLAGGRVLVIQSNKNDVLYFWDVTTGRPLPDWELPQPREGTGTIGELESTGGDRYVGLHFHPDREKSANSSSAVDELAEKLVERIPVLRGGGRRSQIQVLDVIERREIGKVPGHAAAFSENGQWLATIDGGIIRVWKMPLGRPWGRSALYAALLVYGSWTLLKLIGQLRRRLGRKRTDEVAPSIQSPVNVAKA
jgi:hypothetical protein